MTDEDKQARIRRLTKHPKLTTGAELLKRIERHRLPTTIEQIERGEKGNKSQRGLFCTCCGTTAIGGHVIGIGGLRTD